MATRAFLLLCSKATAVIITTIFLAASTGVAQEPWRCGPGFKQDAGPSNPSLCRLDESRWVSEEVLAALTAPVLFFSSDDFILTNGMSPEPLYFDPCWDDPDACGLTRPHPSPHVILIR